MALPVATLPSAPFPGISSYTTRWDTTPLPLNIELASPELLKLGLVLVGLDRAPDNLLNPRHSNSAMVKALGGHDDAVVSQYSVWAVTENTKLSIGDLGVDIKTVEHQPSNVRSWMFRLVAMTAKAENEYLDIIRTGAGDVDSEARLGLAVGLKDSYFDGLDPVIIDWYYDEQDGEIRGALLDHLVKFAEMCGEYEKAAIEAFQKAPAGSLARLRLQSAAAKQPIYAQFRRIEYQADGDLFGGGNIVVHNHVKNELNIAGNVQAGAFSVSGNADNNGAIENKVDARIGNVQSALSQAERLIHEAELDLALSAEGLATVKEAKEKPSRSTIDRLLGFFRRADTVAAAVEGGVQHFEEIRTQVEQVAGWLT